MAVESEAPASGNPADLPGLAGKRRKKKPPKIWSFQGRSRTTSKSIVKWQTRVMTLSNSMTLFSVAKAATTEWENLVELAPSDPVEFAPISPLQTPDPYPEEIFGQAASLFRETTENLERAAASARTLTGLLEETLSALQEGTN
ncbi:MAG: hypothetical protein ACRBN8_43295 [Nannocystales bacterium]